MESSISRAVITKLIYTEITYVLDYLSELDFYIADLCWKLCCSDRELFKVRRAGLLQLKSSCHSSLTWPRCENYRSPQLCNREKPARRAVDPAI